MLQTSFGANSYPARNAIWINGIDRAMFLFCIEASHKMGMGHLFRALNLYMALQNKDYKSIVVLLGSDSASQKWLASASVPFTTVEVTENSNWELRLIAKYRPKVWVNDRLKTDIKHAERIKKAGLKLVTFDDYGSGASLADLHVAALSGIWGQLPAGKKVLTGPEYLAMPLEINKLRRLASVGSRWVVTLGGSDTHGVTISVVRWLNARSKPATILLGPAFAHEKALSLLDTSALTVKRRVPSLLKELASHDLAITGGGLTAFEAAAIGVPTAVIANEPWEVAHAKYLQGIGCSVFVGTHNQINLSFLDNEMDLMSMSSAALRAFPAEGCDKLSVSLIELFLERE